MSNGHADISELLRINGIKALSLRANPESSCIEDTGDAQYYKNLAIFTLTSPAPRLTLLFATKLCIV
jgi:hypothetical protein